MMTNILVTGSTGFVGSHLINYLQQNSNNTIYALTRSVCANQKSTFNTLNLHHKENVNVIMGDMTNFQRIYEIVSKYNINKIFHLAAQSIVQSANSNPISTYQNNVLGTLNLMESTRKIDKYIPVLVTSSDKAYGINNLPYTEDMPLNGLDIYSSSKSCQDIISRSYAYNYDMPIVVSRSCNIYGEYDFNWSRIIPQFIKAYLTNEKITVYTNTSKQVREYIYINDLVKSLELLISNIDKTKGEAFNISSGERFNVNDILDKFKEITDFPLKNIEYIEKDKGFKEIPDQYLNTSKLRSTIRWKPQYTLEKGLRETINKYEKWFSIKNEVKDIHNI